MFPGRVVTFVQRKEKRPVHGYHSSRQPYIQRSGRTPVLPYPPLRLQHYYNTILFVFCQCTISPSWVFSLLRRECSTARRICLWAVQLFLSSSHIFAVFLGFNSIRFADKKAERCLSLCYTTDFSKCTDLALVFYFFSTLNLKVLILLGRIYR